MGSLQRLMREKKPVRFIIITSSLQDGRDGKFELLIYSNYVRMHILSPLLLLVVIHNGRNKYIKTIYTPALKYLTFNKKLLANKLSLNHSHHVLSSLRKIDTFYKILVIC